MRKRNRSASVRHVARSARPLLTIDVDPTGYAGEEGMGAIHEQLCGHDLDGAIVRLRPTGWIDGEAIDAVVRSLRADGAVAVKVLPCPPGGEVVVEQVGTVQRRSLRQIVDEMVDEAKGVDVDALRAMVGEIMEVEGL